MTLKEPDTPREPGPIAKAVGGLGIFAVLKHWADREIDDPVPKVTLWTDRTRAIRKVADRLGEEGREDAGAVKELKRVAGRRHKELRRAAATIRSSRLDLDDIASNRALRLVLAAAADRPVEPLSKDDADWFHSLEVLAKAPLDEAYPQLAALDPELGLFEEEVRTAAQNRRPEDADYEERVHNLIFDRLQLLIGAEAKVNVPLLRTRQAWYVCIDHLGAVAGLPDPYDEAE